MNNLFKQPIDWKAARVRARLSQTKVARYLGISQSTLSRFEKGAARLSDEKQFRLLRLLLEKQGQ